MNAPAGAPRVAIIGSGFSGIAAAIELRKKGIEDFTIFEKAPALGGTWFYNRYPGAEVDLESHIYSFSFERYDWSRIYVDWKELLGYLNHVANKWDLPRRIRFNEKVEDVTWSDTDHTYTLTTATGEQHGPFTAVISAVGFLNIPVLPPFAREEHDFKGIVCHTSRWPEGADMTGKAVGVVGTGSSAVQIVTEAERVGKSVKIFQIEPNWILPKGSRAFTPTERKLNKLRPVYAYRRAKLYLGYDLRQIRSAHARSDGWANKKRHKISEEFLRTELASRPDLLKLATPEFPYEGRRTVLSDTYYKALLSPKVTLVPHAVKGLTSKGAIDANGEEHELDMIVMATGFDAANYLGNYRVHGCGGVELHDEWRGEPEAYLGMMVPKFPNFFIMYGPNTNSVPLVSFYETQAEFAASLIKRAAKERRSEIEVRRSAFVVYNEWLQEQLAKTVWGGTRNYFQAGTGRVVSQWPFGVTPYRLLAKLTRRIAVRLS